MISVCESEAILREFVSRERGEEEEEGEGSRSSMTGQLAAIPFQDDGAIVLTLGYLVVAGCCMPMGFLNLDEV